MPQIEKYSYADAFSRNLGLISTQEQHILSNKCVAIAGCGGVGSAHAHTLARLGVGKFKLADPDQYDIVNFNRQFAATCHTLGMNKAKATSDMILSINPHAEVEIMTSKVDATTVEKFIKNADIVLDGIDFFEMEARRILFQTARKKNIPALTAAPLGFSATLHIFTADSMSFDDYFDLDDKQKFSEQIIHFILGLAPSALQLPYLDLKAVDPETGRGPSSIIGVQLAASLVGAEVVRILLQRNKSQLAPAYLQFDAYRQKLRRRKLYNGNHHWLQKIKKKLLTRKLKQIGVLEALKNMD